MTNYRRLPAIFKSIQEWGHALLNNMAEKHMLDSSSSADFEGANSEQKRIKLEEQLGQTQGKVSVL